MCEIRFFHFLTSLSLSSLFRIPVIFSDELLRSGAADGGGATVPENQTAPIREIFTFLDILFYILLESELRFFEKSLNRSRSEFES